MRFIGKRIHKLLIIEANLLKNLAVILKTDPVLDPKLPLTPNTLKPAQRHFIKIERHKNPIP